MKTVAIDGVTYTKVSELAKKHKYTADYLGQLCRSGKIDAELVGRAWYASEDSLMDHKAGRYTNTSESEMTNNNKIKVHSSDRKTVIPVHPRLSKKTTKALASVPAPAAKQFYRHQAIEQSLYIPDETELTPQPRVQRMEAARKPSVEVRIPVNPAQSEKIKVKNTSEKRDFSFSRVPTVTLRGDLRISDLDEEESQADFLVSETDLHALAPKKRIRPNVPGVTRVKVEPLTRTAVSTEAFAPEREAVSLQSVSFSPSSVVQVPVTKSYIVPVTFVAAVAIALVLLGVDTVLVTDGVSVTQNLSFSAASIVAFFSHF